MSLSYVCYTVCVLNGIGVWIYLYDTSVCFTVGDANFDTEDVAPVAGLLKLFLVSFFNTSYKFKHFQSS